MGIRLDGEQKRGDASTTGLVGTGRTDNRFPCNFREGIAADGAIHLLHRSVVSCLCWGRKARAVTFYLWVKRKTAGKNRGDGDETIGRFGRSRSAG